MVCCLYEGESQEGRELPLRVVVEHRAVFRRFFFAFVRKERSENMRRYSFSISLWCVALTLAFVSLMNISLAQSPDASLVTHLKQLVGKDVMCEEVYGKITEVDADCIVVTTPKLGKTLIPIHAIVRVDLWISPIKIYVAAHGNETVQ
jgi:hypothetical protein